MILSDTSITRPVFASVLSLLLIAFGIVAFDRLPLREYPDIDPPVVTVQTNYPGAAANVVESRITKLIEERIAGVEGIKFMESSSTDGRSSISVEFNIGRDIDGAANDIRDRVAGISNNLPEEADPTGGAKSDSSDDVILWLNLSSSDMTVPELTDYADRYLVDRFSVLDGVARIRIGGQQIYAMRVWIDRVALAARNLTVNDIENALRAENVELPAGSIESQERQFTVRVERAFRTAEDFASLVLARGDDGYLVRLGDVAQVVRATEEDRTMFRGNGIAMVGIGIIKQSTANTLEVVRAALQERERINDGSLPEGTVLEISYNTAVFVENAIEEVYKTLFIAIALVVIVIYLFLGSLRAVIVPAVAVPVSVISTFLMLYVLGFSVNLLTLLALVLAIGMVVDDAIVVLENVYRRMDEEKETPLVAAYLGTRQVGFAVIATTLVLMAVFVPIAFLEGDLGRLFSEFALTMAAAVAFSSLVALTLSPMVASKVLKRGENPGRVTQIIDSAFGRVRRVYHRLLLVCLKRPIIVLSAFALLAGAAGLMFSHIPSEYAPREDRGAFFVMVNGPEGASFEYTKEYMDEIERRLMSYVESGEVIRLIMRAPRGFGNTEDFSGGMVIAVLAPWGERRPGFDIMNEVQQKLADLPGVRAFPVMRQGFGGGAGKPVQFVLGGGTYEELAVWRDTILDKINENNPGLDGVDWDYKETKPQLRVRIDYNRAAELGVKVDTIGRTLETMLGGRRVTTYIEDGEEYDVIIEGVRGQQNTPSDMQNIYVRSDRSGQLIPLSNVVNLEEFADANSLNRYNRVRSITIEANLAEGYTLGEALKYLEGLARANLPDKVIIDYKGQSQDYKYSGSSMIFVFLLGVVVVFLVLAAQFESWVHPLVIMLTVPLAMIGGLAGLFVMGATLNIYTQIGLIMLVGLAAKNGILIVEFINQLRDGGMEFQKAIVEASETRLRPILMTSITTAVGAVPLIIATGAGAETRAAIGIVVLFGMLAATFFTIFVVPAAYSLLCRRTGSPGDVRRRLEAEMNP
ncbi:MAG: efflux RND transporter permease subunit [Alphaproteobacteria bacterium]|nr:efflux RND transporter permease subunit [Alphaproteobacteria bacterium]